MGQPAAPLAYLAMNLLLTRSHAAEPGVVLICVLLSAGLYLVSGDPPSALRQRWLSRS